MTPQTWRGTTTSVTCRHSLRRCAFLLAAEGVVPDATEVLWTLLQLMVAPQCCTARLQRVSRDEGPKNAPERRLGITARFVPLAANEDELQKPGNRVRLSEMQENIGGAGQNRT